MQRTSVSLPDDLALIVRREARRRSISVSELTREALEQHLNPPRDRFPWIGKYRSDGSVPASEVKEWLRENWAQHIEVEERSDPGDR
jgi:hypothetical protein